MMAEIIEFFKDAFKYIVIIAIIILVRIFVLSTTEVIGPSMEPNFMNADFLLVEQVSTRLNNYKRFDIVVIKYSFPSYIIKRVIGLPNETIKYVDNNLYVNDQLVLETFDHSGVITDFEITLDDDSYYVIGDNRDDSEDSRVFGAINKNVIKGKPLFVLYPFNRIKNAKKI